MKTKDELIDDLLDLAFAEDLGDGDHTTLSTIPENAMGRSRLIIKEDGILAGVKVAEKVLHRVDPSIKMTVMIGDGAEVNKGDVAFTAEGFSRPAAPGMKHGGPLQNKELYPPYAPVPWDLPLPLPWSHGPQ